MRLCDSIDTLVLAFLDDELAGVERREVALHLTKCSDCRAHFDRECIEHVRVRTMLVARRAPELLRALVARALDAEDIAEKRIVRRRILRWVLPGSAVLAAVAAIAMFVGA